ncbi:MAG: NAD-dependent epimerase/dehydratase family protein [Flavobacteriaceae bacterium]|nr:NAD-dependent epimerase/dehydratase family protein [Flavobacteriaceae bacterium]
MILVTGATGMLGTHIIAALLGEHRRIKALYRSEEKKNHCLEFLRKKGVLGLEDILWVKADLSELLTLSGLFDEVTYVVHCAAIISNQKAARKRIFQTNYVGTKYLVDLLLEHPNIKLCHISSIAVLESEPSRICDESSYYNPDADHGYYSESKHLAEMEVWRGIQEGLNAVILLPGVILGEGFWNSGSGKLFDKIHSGIRFFPTGKSGFIDVNDVVQVVLTTTFSDISNQRFVLVAENQSFQWVMLQVAIALHKTPPQNALNSRLLLVLAHILSVLTAFGIKNPLPIYSVRALFNSHCYSAQKIESLLGITWTPLEKSIRRISEEYLKDQAS